MSKDFYTQSIYKYILDTLPKNNLPSPHYTDTHTQTHTDTHRHIQPHPYTHRETHTDTHRDI